MVVRQLLKPALLLATIAVAAASTPASAQTTIFFERPVRYGNTSSFFYDSRNDNRDFPTNGVFPGNFAANPFGAVIGRAGFLESNPYGSRVPYPSQSHVVVVGAPVDCQRYRVDETRKAHRARCGSP